MKRYQNNATVLIGQNHIVKLCDRLAQQISNDYKSIASEDNPLFLVCVLKGSLIFTADLMRKLTVPVTLDFVKLSSYGKGTTSTRAVRIVKDLSSSVEGKHVLVVEDILDTGHTLSFFCDRLKALQPRSLKVCTLLDKPSRREASFKADYVGEVIENHFVIGYGLDVAEKCRNYSEIWQLNSVNQNIHDKKGDR